MHRPALLIACLAVAAPALADETRQLGAHEHGVGHLDIAVEGGTVAIALRSPGADIVGFEHEAKGDADRAAIRAGIAALARPLDLFVLPQAAGCTLMSAAAELEVLGAHGGHAHGDDHGHAHDHAHGDDHAHDHAHDHGHDHADGGDARHTEFHADYTLNCAVPGALTSIEFAYFDAFENARALSIQIVTDRGAQGFEVTRDAPSLALDGLM